MIQPKATSDSPTNLGNYFSPKNKLDTPNVTLGIDASQNKKGKHITDAFKLKTSNGYAMSVRIIIVQLTLLI